MYICIYIYMYIYIYIYIYIGFWLAEGHSEFDTYGHLGRDRKTGSYQLNLDIDLESTAVLMVGSIYELFFYMVVYIQSNCCDYTEMMIILDYIK
jgi:hypothetical protein